MSEHDSILELVRESFNAEASDVTLSGNLATVVRARLRHRRLAKSITASVAIVALAIGASLIASTGKSVPQTKTIRLSNYTFQVPADARTSLACLGNTFEWTRQWSPPGESITIELFAVREGVVDDHCTVVVLTVTTTPPPSVSVTKGADGRIVHIAAPVGDNNIVYVELTPAQYAHYARANDQPASTRYYLIGETSSSTDPSVIAAVLPQAESIMLERFFASINRR